MTNETSRSTGPLPAGLPRPCSPARPATPASADLEEGDVVDLDADRPTGHRSGVGRLGDERFEVEDLEDPLEGHRGRS